MHVCTCCHRLKHQSFILWEDVIENNLILSNILKQILIYAYWSNDGNFIILFDLTKETAHKTHQNSP